MLLFAGLGNPGAQYVRNRHNIGFMAVDEVVRRHGFGSWRRKFQGEIAEGILEGVKVLAVKPLTFMNDSGRCVGQAMRFYGIEPGDLYAFHDEIDLVAGKVRVKLGGGTAGHNGLKDTQARLSTPEFWRLRIGIGHPRTLQVEQDVADFVLHPPRKDEQTAIDQALERAEAIVDLLVDGKFEAAMLRLHTR